jgi:long-chain acyl-CoA synthetase
MANEKPRLTYWPVDVPRSINYPVVLLHEILVNTARDYPKQIAVEFLDAQITYEKLNRFSDQFAASLAHLGVKQGEQSCTFSS